MATKDEILNSRIIGFIEPVLNSYNARVTVVGYKNSDGEYVALDKGKADSIFYPDGKVFAPVFQSRYKNIPLNSFVEFSVLPSTRNAGLRGDDYIMDYSKQIVSKTFISILTLGNRTSIADEYITQDELSQNINKSDLSSCSSSFFLRSKAGNYLYGLFKYDARDNSIRPVKGKEADAYEIDDSVSKKYFIKVNQREYFIGNLNSLPFKHNGIIDCMTDKQLGEWFKEQLNTCAVADSSRQKLNDVFKDLATKFSETNDELQKIRLERAKGKLNSLKFTFEEIKKLLDSNSSLTQTLNATLQGMKDEYQKSWAATLESSKKELEKEIETLKKTKESLEKDVDTIQSEYDEKKSALESGYSVHKAKIEKETEELQLKLDNVTKNYDSIIVAIQAHAPQQAKTSFDCIEIQPVEFAKDGSTFTELENNYGYTFEILLEKNLELDVIPEVVKAQLNRNSPLFTNKACFIPNVSWAYLYAKAIRNSKLFNIHVEHDWLHYKDFMNNGVASVLTSCYENEGVNHILILDSLNLTQPECGLQPLLDVIAGYAPIISGIGKPYPNNLKIFATLQSYTDKIGLPLSNNNFSSWGRIASVDDKILIGTNVLECDENLGYFEPNDLLVKSVKDNSQDKNGYFN